MFIQGKSITHAAQAKVPTRAVAPHSGRSTNHQLKLQCHTDRGRPHRWYRLQAAHTAGGKAAKPYHHMLNTTHTPRHDVATARKGTMRARSGPHSWLRKRQHNKTTAADVAPDSVARAAALAAAYHGRHATVAALHECMAALVCAVARSGSGSWRRGCNFKNVAMKSGPPAQHKGCK
jgi:hypothetical protein